MRDDDILTAAVEELRALKKPKLWMTERGLEPDGKSVTQPEQAALESLESGS